MQPRCSGKASSFVNGQIAVDGMGEAYSTHGSDDKCTQSINRKI
jgi:hypothetical protein